MKLSTQHMRTLAWLGLFAMLMVFIAPSISSHLSKNNINNKEMTMDMPMGGEHDEHMAMMSHQPEDSPPAGHGMADMASGACFDLCGYCSLLHHNPPLMALIPAAPPLPIQCAPRLIHAIYLVITLATFPFYQTRAPPLFPPSAQPL
ncbi:DUF2946 domain-containing protein [Serratia plymuthica]|uniref:DUF2946 domain-containing protein n=1 Tax=Serratia plymuthica TaxID=82996 RepID=UPI00141926F0|nr:DUF2946 domain-containing protein [Serratia plymuthica]NIC26196.1 DUF2946 domain-containing protein [Serratia plymuthica]QPS87576.1 DUF2946 domain-containing protein [Serratia plymuthica]